MAKKKTVFTNPFSSKRITPVRLVDFAKDVSARLNKSSNGDQYSSIVSQLTIAVDALEKDLTDMDSSSTQKQNKVLTCNQVMSSLKKTMREKEGAIAHFLGGRTTDAYRAFYPKGITEYRLVNKAKLPGLLKRITIQTTAYSAKMDDSMIATLNSVGNGWSDSSTNLSVTKSDISDEQIKLMEDRVLLENALNAALLAIAQKFNGDEQKCVSFFDFTLLYAKTRTRKKPNVNNTKIELPPPHTPEA